LYQQIKTIMSKVKVIYSVSTHLKEKSHEMRIVQDQSVVRGVKLKMTYEAYNANERFVGEQWVGGKWEHSFDMLDLGVTSERSAYNIWNEGKREDRAEKLFKLGIVLFNTLNS
jgi:hypothetical protein